MSEDKKMLLAIIGADGQLGSELVKYCQDNSIPYLPYTHETICVENWQFVAGALSPAAGITAVINTAASHRLEECEASPEDAWAVNALGSAHVAQWCSAAKCKYVFVSSDYCNPASNYGHYPLSVYAKTKMAGELAALSLCKDALVVRVGSLYGVRGCRAKCGQNLVDTIATKLQNGEKFSLPAYTEILPTSAREAAKKIIRNLRFNPSHTGVCSAADSLNTMSHYDLGGLVAAYMGISDPPLQAISKDPTDKIRPHIIDYSGVDGLLAHDDWLDAFDVRTPLYDYLIEKGFADARTG